MTTKCRRCCPSSTSRRSTRAAKTLVWFEHSSHLPNTEERERFQPGPGRIRPPCRGQGLVAGSLREAGGRGGVESVNDPEETTPMTWYETIPKVELHIHLEGAIPHDALFALIQKYGGDPAVPDVPALVRRFEYKSFPEFIDTWIWKNQFLREYEDFTHIAELTARDMAGQGIRYAEMFFSPSSFARRGMSRPGTDTGGASRSREGSGHRDRSHRRSGPELRTPRPSSTSSNS